MGTIPIATLNGTDLPIQFSYQPPISEKRITTTRTHGAVIVQAATDVRVEGDALLSWKCEASSPTEFMLFYDLYNVEALTQYTFTGYWGEELEVYFTKFDPPDVKGRIFNMSGAFQVVSITTDFDAQCGF